jgi:hypothetical protein
LRALFASARGAVLAAALPAVALAEVVPVPAALAAPAVLVAPALAPVALVPDALLAPALVLVALLPDALVALLDAARPREAFAVEDPAFAVGSSRSDSPG